MSKTGLTKKQIKKIEEYGFPPQDKYTEQQIREGIGLKTHFYEVGWDDAAYYVFVHFNKFSTEFKREVRENYIQELIKEGQMSIEEATENVDEWIANAILSHLKMHFDKDYRPALDMFSKDDFVFLQQLKDGNLFDFINVKHLI
jgi:polyhydroxyalkanoate synthesis regulator phasin